MEKLLLFLKQQFGKHYLEKALILYTCISSLVMFLALKHMSNNVINFSIFFVFIMESFIAICLSTEFSCKTLRELLRFEKRYLITLTFCFIFLTVFLFYFLYFYDIARYLSWPIVIIISYIVAVIGSINGMRRFIH